MNKSELDSKRDVSFRLERSVRRNLLEGMLHRDVSHAFDMTKFLFKQLLEVRLTQPPIDTIVLGLSTGVVMPDFTLRWAATKNIS